MHLQLPSIEEGQAPISSLCGPVTGPEGMELLYLRKKDLKGTRGMLKQKIRPQIPIEILAEKHGKKLNTITKVKILCLGKESAKPHYFSKGNLKQELRVISY